jgi:hypothetical protein
MDMFVPGFFTVGIVVGPEMGILHIYFLWAYVGTIFFYLALVVAKSVRLSVGNGIGFVFKLIAAFFVIHMGLGIGLLKGLYKRGIERLKTRKIPSQN